MTKYLLGSEMVCPRCLAGVESSEHHYECVVPAEVAAAETPSPALLEEGEYERIRDAYLSRPWDDRKLDSQYVDILLPLAGAIASPGGSREWCADEATQALRRVMVLVLRGEMEAEVNRHG